MNTQTFVPGMTSVIPTGRSKRLGVKPKRRTKKSMLKLIYRFFSRYSNAKLVIVYFIGTLTLTGVGAYAEWAVKTMTPIAVQASMPRKPEVEKVEPKASKLEALKGTKMQDAIPYIERAAVYYGLPIELYLGIAFAESSFNNFRPFNPWGIDTGKGQDPRTYPNWEASVNGFSQLVKYYYWNEGKITPEQMRDKYVGAGIGSPNWISNVKKFYNPQIEIKL